MSRFVFRSFPVGARPGCFKGLFQVSAYSLHTVLRIWVRKLGTVVFPTSRRFVNPGHGPTNYSMLLGYGCQLFRIPNDFLPLGNHTLKNK